MTDQPHDVGPMRGPVAQVCEALSRVLLAVAGLSLICIVAINGANVIARYFFGKPFAWAEEVMIIFMILGVFAGSVTVTWRNIHIRIDTFVDRMTPLWRRIAKTLVTAASMVVLLAVVVASYRIVALLYSFDQRTDALEWPMWIPQSFVTIGLALIALLMGVRLALSRFR